MRRAWRLFLAHYHLDLDAVCEMSAGRLPEADFHSWHDSTLGAPWFQCLHYCKRCGKAFTI